MNTADYDLAELLAADPFLTADEARQFLGLPQPPRRDDKRQDRPQLCTCGADGHNAPGQFST